MIQGTLLNNDAPVDLTGSTVLIAILTPNKTNLNQPCTITSATEGKFEVLLDEAAYATLGEHQAQFRVLKGTELNITDRFYYESVDAIPV
jgi:hypothetical protein